MLSAILRLHCPDSKGIVYHVSRFIFEHGGNIIQAEQHTEELDNRFFMRVHFDCTDLKVSRQEMMSGVAELANMFSMETQLSFSDQQKRMAIMVSKYDHCLYDLALRHRYGEINADIACVLSNHTETESVAAAFKIPFFFVPVTGDTKSAAEERALGILRSHHVDFVVLARYMQVLSPFFVSAFRHKIINVHHGFLPAFRGAKPYHQAYEHGVKLIGATSHYVTEELDTGPIIEQQITRVDHSHSVDQMVAMGRDVEKLVLANAVKAHAADRIMVYRRRTIVFD